MDIFPLREETRMFSRNLANRPTWAMGARSARAAGSRALIRTGSASLFAPLLSGALLLGPLCVPAPAQTRSSQPVPAVTFRYVAVPRDSGPAARILRVHVEIAPGWHINSDAPLDELLVPTTLEAKADGAEFGKPRFPPPERVHSDVMGGDMLLLSGAFEVDLPVLRKAGASGKPPAPAAQSGAQDPPRTRVTLRYQSCDHATCYPPKEVVVER
jgi:hypothetical protein